MASPIFLNPKHLADLRGSGIPDQLIASGFESISQIESSKLVGFKTLSGGWRTINVNPENGVETLEGVQYKPDFPGKSSDGKVMKYVGQRGIPTHPCFLKMPDSDYWPGVVANPTIQVVITEGAKKAGCLLGLGYAAVSIPGVWNFRESVLDAEGREILGKNGKPLKKLHSKLALFCQPGREIILAFDADLETNPNVRNALAALAMEVTRYGT